MKVKYTNKMIDKINGGDVLGSIVPHSVVHYHDCEPYIEDLSTIPRELRKLRCRSIQEVVIDVDFLSVDGLPILSDNRLKDVYQNCGFESFTGFSRWIYDNWGLPFQGYFVRWFAKN